eukprot:GFUD01012370.1.p1 GENE.GFUD01012370.1~~GFUD01012370.1.p1  ORF type:complete len:477 (-),score=163.99 GFUD01012370.1:904-2334(-)
MKTSLWSSLVATIRSWLDRLLWRAPPAHTLYPKCLEDLLTIMTQARDNGTTVKVVGGACPTSPNQGDIVVSLQYMDRLLGLDTTNRTVKVEPGMKLSTLSSLLGTINLSMDLGGRVPDLTVLDCVAVGGPGLGCGATGLGSSIVQVEVVTARGELASWAWDTHTRQMGGLVGGLGMLAVVISVTINCCPVVMVSEISYLSSVREVVDTWSMVHRTSNHQQITWFPFTELVIITHTSSLDKLSFASCQSRLFMFLTEASEWLATLIRRVNIVCFSSLPMLSSVLARVQFISLWTAARYRSDHAHHPVHFLPPSHIMRGTSWLLPLDCLPPLLHNISTWSQANPGPVTSPIFIQTVVSDSMAQCETRSRTSSVGSAGYRSQHAPQGVHGQGYLCPRLGGSVGPLASVWYDWFLPETSPDPLQVSHLEGLFHQVGGVRCWGAERLVSPLLLSNTYNQYKDWCKGTVFSKPVTRVEVEGN